MRGLARPPVVAAVDVDEQAGVRTPTLVLDAGDIAETVAGRHHSSPDARFGSDPAPDRSRQRCALDQVTVLDGETSSTRCSRRRTSWGLLLVTRLDQG
jgi:hypothetical protein